MSNAKETYEVRRSEFTRQENWIPELLASSLTLSGFFLQFQSAFGRSASPNGSDDFKGLYMSQNDMASLMNDAGISLDRKTINRNLKQLTDLGIVSKAPVCDPGFLESSSNRIVWVYVINKTAPHEFDRLAEKLALQLLEKSKFKGQAKNSAKKKEREVAGESNTIVAAREIARLLTDNNQLKGYVVDYLTTSEATVHKAATAVKSVKAYGKVSKGAFDAGLNDFAIRFPREEETAIAKMRDALNRARQADKPATEAAPKPAVIKSEPVLPTGVRKTQEELNTEDLMRQEDLEAEHQALFDAALAGLTL